VVVGAAAKRPTKQALLFFDGKIVDAGMTNSREAVLIEFPILIAVRPMPLA